MAAVSDLFLTDCCHENALGNRMPTWEEGLKKYLQER